ncbi:MAG: polysaccharide deacetylase family protein [Clostridiales bacterium]|nr:polysaccharide deacetylase family protein [Clostridiales bacterium]
MIRIKNKPKFLSLVLGNIVMVATVAALLLLTVTDVKAERAGGGKPYYSGKSDTKVSLMINVYWGTEYIEPMLDVLAKHNVKTTFFVGGSWAAANAETLKRIHAAGHEIGNHGYYHKDHSKIDGEYNKREIRSAHDVVKDIVGVDMDLFAPPSGAFNDTTLKAAAELGYRTIMWTRDTIDWRDHDTDLIYRRAVKNVKGGDLILMHPTENTLFALERIITEVYSQGLEISTVGDVLSGTTVA